MCLRMTSRRRSSPVCTRFVDNLESLNDLYNAAMLFTCKHVVYNIFHLFPPSTSVTLCTFVNDVV
jgi:hypothetical protein